VVTCFTSTPRVAHLNAMLYIFYYLQGIVDLALYY
jgi:hypothetical protein